MKNKFLLLMWLLYFASHDVEAQRIMFNKVLDSIEVLAIKDNDGVTTITLKHANKIDTLWHDAIGAIGVYRIKDIQFFKDRFAIIYYASHQSVELVIGEWDGISWQRNSKSYSLAFGWYKNPCRAEILDFDKVRVVQKGISTIITVDAEKDGVELNRTIEKQ